MGTSLVVQWLRLCASNVGDTCSISGWGTKTPYASWHVARKKKLYTIYNIFFIFVCSGNTTAIGKIHKWHITSGIVTIILNSNEIDLFCTLVYSVVFIYSVLRLN